MSTPIVALLEKRGFLYNHSGDFPQAILILSQSRAEQLSSHFFIFGQETFIYYVCQNFSYSIISDPVPELDPEWTPDPDPVPLLL